MRTTSVRSMILQAVLLAAAGTVACSASTAGTGEDVDSVGEATTTKPIYYDDEQPPPKPIILPCCIPLGTERGTTCRLCSAPVTKPTVECAFDPSCPPDMYGNSANGCSLTAPAASACVTTSGATDVPGFSAPTITKVVVGGGGASASIYAIGIPSVPITTLPAGGAYTDNRSAVFAWGDNSSYQLGTGNKTAATTPVVSYFNPNDPVVDVAAGAQDACALTKSGLVYCWGEIMTLPTIVTWPTPQQVQLPAGTVVTQITHGQNHACALTTANQVYCWGNNDVGQLGVPLWTPPVTYSGTPVLASLQAADSTQLTAAQISASGRTTCIVTTVPAGSPPGTSGNGYCWGDDTLGGLGDNGATEGNSETAATPIALESGFTLDGVGQIVSAGASSGAVDSNYGSFCALDTTSNGWFCWGADDDGQIDETPPVANSLGEAQGIQAPEALPSTFSATSTLYLGTDHGCGLVPGGGSTPAALYCFGSNQAGQLGVAKSNGVTGAPILQPLPSGWTQYAGAAAGENVTCAFAAPSAISSGAAAGNLACWGNVDGVVSSSTPAVVAW